MQLVVQTVVKDKSNLFTLLRRPVKRNWHENFAVRQTFPRWLYLAPTLFFSPALFAGFEAWLASVVLTSPALFGFFLRGRLSKEKYFFRDKAISQSDRESFERVLSNNAGTTAIKSNLGTLWWVALMEIGELHDQITERIAQKSMSNSISDLISTRDALLRLYFDYVAKTEKFHPYFGAVNSNEEVAKIMEREFLGIVDVIRDARKAAEGADVVALMTDVSNEIPPSLGEMAIATRLEETTTMIDALRDTDVYSGRRTLEAVSPEDLLMAKNRDEIADALLDHEEK